MKQNLLTKVLLLCALIVGSSSMAWAVDKTITITSSSLTNYSGTAVTYGHYTWSAGGISGFANCAKNDDSSAGNPLQFNYSSSGTSSYRDKQSVYNTVEVPGRIKSIKMTRANKGSNRNWTVYAAATALTPDNLASTTSKWEGGTKSVTTSGATWTTPTNSNYTYFCCHYTTSNASYISKIEITYEEEEDETLEDATWSVEPSEVVLNYGESTTVQITTNYDGTLEVGSADTNIATISYNSTTKEIAVTAVGYGKTTINISGNATDNYKAINKTINVTVPIEELPQNAKVTIADLGYNFWNEITSSGSSADEINGSSNGITIKVEKGEGTAPRADGNYWRFYQKNKMTITAPSGAYITKIVFIEPSSNKQWEGTMTVTNGVYLNDDKTWYAINDVSSIELTGKNGTCRIGSMEVYLMVSPVGSKISASGWNTFSSNFPIDLSTIEGGTAYVASDVTDGKVVLTAATGKVPAGTGLMIKGTPEDDFSIAVTEDETTAPTNLLVGLPGGGEVAAASTGYNYVFGWTDPENPGFYKIVTDKPTLVVGKAYLHTTEALNVVTGSAPFLGIDTDGETTGIVNVNRVKITDNQYYTLDGRRVAQPTKGLYIINGKKVVIK